MLTTSRLESIAELLHDMLPRHGQTTSAHRVVLDTKGMPDVTLYKNGTVVTLQHPDMLRALLLGDIDTTQTDEQIAEDVARLVGGGA